MHILHATFGAAGALRLQSDLDIIDHCEDADDLDLWMRHAEYDAVVLDPLAGSSVGRRWARRYRSGAGRAGLIFVVDEVSADLAIPLYDICDDLVRLPMRPDEVLARIGAVARRCRGFESACLRVGDLALDYATLRARYAGRDLRLTPREFCLVEFLMLRAGRALGKDAICTRIYQERDGAEPKIVDVFVCKVRAKMVEAGAPADLIQTVRGFGFMIARATAAEAALRSVA